jgi:hypothetical protein
MFSLCSVTERRRSSRSARSTLYRCATCERPKAPRDSVQQEFLVAETFGPIAIVDARDEREIEAAFATLAQRRTAAVLVASDPFFFSRREQIVALVARYRLPAIYEW